MKKSKANRRKSKAGNGRKTKARKKTKNKSWRKKYFLKCDIDTLKNLIKVRLHMWEVNYNHKRENADTKYANIHYVKNQKTPENMCWNVRQLSSSYLVKKQ